MLGLNDEFDPTTWLPDTHEYRIYLDERCTRWAIVDQVDYQWALQYRWCINKKKNRDDPLKFKEYARRAVGENHQGVRIKTITLYLHVEIMKRAQPKPPSKRHLLVDHRNGIELDCRRENLRWATHSMNVRNRLGQYPRDLHEN